MIEKSDKRDLKEKEEGGIPSGNGGATICVDLAILRV